jgi:hypothetical protein
MSKAQYLAAEFRTPKNTRGGILMLTAGDACRLIARAEEEKIRVLGIDSFMLTETSTQPLIEHSVDYSARDFVADSDWRTAIAFIEGRASLGFHFEVVLGDEVTVRKEPNQPPQTTRGKAPRV